MNLKEQLETKGFVFEIDEDKIFSQYVKNIGQEGKKLVFAITPLPECFVWVPEEPGEDYKGFRVTLDIKDVDTAILVAESIAEVE